ncbi:MAG: imidazoleglycerol-phosphate dehydratase, partial [Gemmatimonadaceae bacterium]
MTVVVRETKETTIRCELVRGTGRASVATGHTFLDHMLVAFAKYSGLDLSVEAKGDMAHHLVEDVGICVGAAVAG